MTKIRKLQKNSTQKFIPSKYFKWKYTRKYFEENDHEIHSKRLHRIGFGLFKKRDSADKGGFDSSIRLERESLLSYKCTVTLSAYFWRRYTGNWYGHPNLYEQKTKIHDFKMYKATLYRHLHNENHPLTTNHGGASSHHNNFFLYVYRYHPKNWKHHWRRGNMAKSV